MPSQFIHVADVHLDSPLSSIRKLGGSIAERLQRASRASFQSVVDIALERQVEAVLIAGDLFDGPIKDASAALWVESQFRRLTRAGIPVVLILGNHDAVSPSKRVARWSDGVFECGTEQAETHLLEQAGLAIHGQSFGARAQSADLAAKYPNAVPGFCNVGLLHTSLASPGSHDPYAPTSISVLENMGYDYWALGHVHLRSHTSLSSKCYVGYSGNTQGRHIREAGAKGCHLVTYSDAGVEAVHFHATDCVRWQQLVCNISSAEHLHELTGLLEEKLEDLVVEADSRPVVTRVVLDGETALQGELSRPSTVENLEEHFAQCLQNAGDFWLESVRIHSKPIPRVRHDEVLAPLKYLSRVAEDCRGDGIKQRELEDALEELLRKARNELNEYGWHLGLESSKNSQELSKTNPGETDMSELIRRAENMLVARLIGDNNA